MSRESRVGDVADRPGAFPARLRSRLARRAARGPGAGRRPGASGPCAAAWPGRVVLHARPAAGRLRARCQPSIFACWRGGRRWSGALRGPAVPQPGPRRRPAGGRRAAATPARGLVQVGLRLRVPLGLAASRSARRSASAAAIRPPGSAGPPAPPGTSSPRARARTGRPRPRRRRRAPRPASAASFAEPVLRPVRRLRRVRGDLRPVQRDQSPACPIPSRAHSPAPRRTAPPPRRGAWPGTGRSSRDRARPRRRSPGTPRRSGTAASIRRERRDLIRIRPDQHVTSMSGSYPAAPAPPRPPPRMKRRGVQVILHHLDHQPHRMIRRQPLPHIRRQQKRLIPVHRPVSPRHTLIIPNTYGHTQTATPPQAKPILQQPGEQPQGGSGAADWPGAGPAHHGLAE